jgi:hypothetical protein
VQFEKTGVPLTIAIDAPSPAHIREFSFPLLHILSNEPFVLKFENTMFSMMTFFPLKVHPRTDPPPLKVTLPTPIIETPETGIWRFMFFAPVYVPAAMKTMP